MSQPFDQPRVPISNSSTMMPASHTSASKTTPRLHCAFPKPSSSALNSFELSHPMSCCSSTILINCDNRDTNRNSVTFDNNQGNIDHITSLERTVCSNFYCCGFQLPDFHALLEHFEESHVVVLAPNGKRVYPREGLQAVPLDPVSSGTSTPDLSRASSATPTSPTPSLSSPFSPSSILPPTSSPLSSRKSSFSVPSVYTPFTPTLPIDPAYPLPDTSEVVISQEPDINFDIQSTYIYRPETPEIAPESSSSEDEEMSDGVLSSTDDGSTKLREHVTSNQVLTPEEVSALMVRAKQRFARLGVHEKRKLETSKVASSKSSKSKRHPGSGSSHSKRREKTYRCPKEGCIKIYLNPNGLKYHLERGTCKFADEIDPSDDCSSHLRPQYSTPGTQFAAPSASPLFMDATISPPTPEHNIPPNNGQISNLSALPTTVKSTPPNTSRVGAGLMSSLSPEGNAQPHYRNHDKTVAVVTCHEGDGTHEQGSLPSSVPEQLVRSSRQPAREAEPTSGSPSLQLRPHLHCQTSQITQSLPQQSLHRYHYPVPTYPHGFLYSRDNRAYYADLTRTALLTGPVVPSTS